MAAGALTCAILALFLTQIVVAPKPGSETQSEALNVEDVMIRIAEIFRERLLDMNRKQNLNGSQFAVLALIPSDVETLDDITNLMEPHFEGINYRFARPTRFRNQNRRTHAEVLLMRIGPNEICNLNELYRAFWDRHRCLPQFAVLYTWIHPCLHCTEEIIDNFGQFNDYIPVYIGHTTKGTMIGLTDEDRDAIKNFLNEAGLFLYHIGITQYTITETPE